RCGRTCRTEREAWAAWDMLVEADSLDCAAPAECACSSTHFEAAQADQGTALAHDPTDAGGASYNAADDWTTQHNSAPSRAWHANRRPRDLERWSRRPDLGGRWELRETTDDIQTDQQRLDIGSMPETMSPAMPLIVPQRKTRMQRGTRGPAVRERYAAKL